MKKAMSGMLAAALTLSIGGGALTAQAEQLMVNGEKMDLGAQKLYEENEQTMVPLRLTAEQLGFTVAWEEETQQIRMDNGDVKTTIQIGQDRYYRQSSSAIGLTQAVALGAAPVLVEDSTYVPAAMYDVLLGQGTVTQEEDALNIEKKASGAVQIPNPVATFESLDAMEQAAGFEVKIPSDLPAGYELSRINLISGTLAQLVYQNQEAEITFRTAAATGNISGDYNQYQEETNLELAGLAVTAKGNDGLVFCATWQNQDMAYSITAGQGLTQDQLKEMLESIQ